MYNEYCRLHWGVGWTDLALLRFLKLDTFLAITYIFLSSIPKNLQIWPHLHTCILAYLHTCMHGKVLILKNHMNLKLNMLLKICREQSSARRIEVKNFCIFFMCPKWAKWFLNSLLFLAFKKFQEDLFPPGAGAKQFK